MKKKTFMATTTTVIVLISLMVGMQGVNVANANFYYPPPQVLPAIQIMEDGSIYPLTNLITKTCNTYYLNDNITKEYVLEVYCSDITIDGANHTLDGNYSSGSGVFLNEVTNVTVRNMRISGLAFAGIYLNHTSDCTISGNKLSDIGTAAIYLLNSRGNIVTENQINTNSEGLSLTLSSENELLKNNVTNYGFSVGSYAGIVLLNSPQNNIHENSVIGKSTAVSIITLIYPNETNLNVLSSSNRIYLNNFVNYTVPVYFQYSPFVNYWDDGKTGNYWSSYNGSDTNGDGIGDIPYFLIENNTDHYPLTMIVSDVYPSPSPSLSPSPTPPSTPTVNPIVTPSPSPTQQQTIEPSQTPDRPQIGDFAPVIIPASMIFSAIVAVGLLVYFSKHKGMKK